MLCAQTFAAGKRFLSFNFDFAIPAQMQCIHLAYLLHCTQSIFSFPDRRSTAHCPLIFIEQVSSCIQCKNVYDTRSCMVIIILGKVDNINSLYNMKWWEISSLFEKETEDDVTRLPHTLGRNKESKI